MADDHEIKTEEKLVSDVAAQIDDAVPIVPQTSILHESPIHAPTKSSSIRTAVPRKRPKPQRSWRIWLLSNIARLFIWYTILTVIFRCPPEPSELTKDHPRLCRPYLTAKRYTTPYVEPYYNVYARPYVNKGMPYVNAVKVKVLQPVGSLLVKNYQRFVAPQLAHAQSHLASQGDKFVRPYIENVKDSLQAIYDEKLSQHVQYLSDVTTPYYGTARDNARHAYRSHIMPAVAYMRPQLQRVWSLSRRFFFEKIYPVTRHAGTYVVIFVEGTVWPTIKHIYTNNVRPQLVMISERVSTYQEGKKLQSVLEQVDSSITSSLSSALSTARTYHVDSTLSMTIPIVSSMSSVALSLSSTTAPASSTSSLTASPSTVLTECPIDELVAADLAKWHKKFSVAAETAVQDLRERITEIVHSMVRVDMSEGENLKTALTKTVEVELDTLHLKMQAIADTIKDERGYTKEDQDNVYQAIRSYGQQIKDRAQAVRTWADTYSAALDERVNLAVDSTLHVLDDIRDLGLHDLGTRWAKLEGMTYKHWRDYHDLKRAFARERDEIRNQSMKHPALLDAHNDITRVLEEAMATTEGAVDKLIQVKERVAVWPLDDSSAGLSKDMPIVDRAKNAAVSVSEGLEEVVTVLKDKATDTASSVLTSISVGSLHGSSTISSLIADESSDAEEPAAVQPPPSVAELRDPTHPQGFDASDSLESVWTETSLVLPTETLRLQSVTSHASSSISSIATDLSSTASEMLREASALVVGDSRDAIESLKSLIVSHPNSIILDGPGDTLPIVNDPGSTTTHSNIQDSTQPSPPLASTVTESGSRHPSGKTASSASSVAPNLAASIKSKMSSVEAAISHASGTVDSSISSATQHSGDMIDESVDESKDQARQQEL